MNNEPNWPEDASLLIVDDEGLITKSIEYLFRDRCRVGIALTGERAAELLEDGPYAVVILDINIPGISGLELLRKIKRQHPATEVIMLTGYENEKRTALGNGASEYLTKPFNVEVLERSVAAAMERYAAAAGGRTS